MLGSTEPTPPAGLLVVLPLPAPFLEEPPLHVGDVAVGDAYATLTFSVLLLCIYCTLQGVQPYWLFVIGVGYCYCY